MASRKTRTSRKKTPRRRRTSREVSRQDEFLKSPYYSKVRRRDFDKIGPFKLVPGVQGRTEWFTERLGLRGDSGSLDRLLRGIRSAEESHDSSAIRSLAMHTARSVMEGAQLEEGVRVRSAVAVDPSGRRVPVRVPRTRRKTGWSGIGRGFKLSTLRSSPVIVFVPVDDDSAARLDLDEIVVAEVSDPGNPKLIDTFTYWENEQAIVGRIDVPGDYQAFAFPRDPWIKAAFITLCYYWKWVRYDPKIREITKVSKRQGALGLGIVDRICQLILCAPDYMNVARSDVGVFGSMGVGFPPGYRSGRRSEQIPGDFEGLGGSGNLCERCLGDFIGELKVDRDIILIPPIIKWCWVRRPRCTRWKSLGPIPAPDFAGIGRITQVDIHPTDGDTLVAGSAGGGVWRTDNGGASWRRLMELEPTLTIGAVAIAPSNPKVIYAASGEDAGGYNPAWPGVGIYRTQNGGGNWDLMTSVPSTRFSAIVVHPSDPDTLYVAGNQGLHKSDDGGQTWKTNAGLDSLFDGRVTDVVIAHDDPDRIYIGVRNDGVYRSTTGGEASGGSSAFTRLDGPNQLPSGGAAGWIKLSIGRNGARGSRFVVAKMGDQGSRIFRTRNGGAVWTELASNVAAVSFDEWASIIAVDPNNERVIYAGAAGTLKRTTNGGANAGDWVSINAGIHSDQQDFAFDPNDSSRVFLANDGGIFRSTNRGTTWTFTSTNLRVTQLYDIDISEKDRDVCAGGAQDNGVFYRNTVGQWARIPWGDGTQVAIDPTDPNIFYFSSQNGLPNWLRRSTDGGMSHSALGTSGLSGSSPWVTIIKLDPTDPIANPADNRIVFVCGANQLFRSTDGGQTWQRVEDGAGAPFTTSGTITALEFAPSDAGILYLGTSNGSVYRGVNGGVAASDWTRIDTAGSTTDALFPNVQIQGLRVHAGDPDSVWVVFGGSGVNFTGRPNMILNPLGISHLFRTSDGGTTWLDASGQFAALSLPDVPTSAVALDDVTSEVAYCGTDVGVFRTTDGGQTWQSFQEGLPRAPVAELRLNRRWNRLYAGTMGLGVWIRDV